MKNAKKKSLSAWFDSPAAKKLRKAFKAWDDKIHAEMSELDKTPPPILHTKWVLSKVLQHIREGGTYRYLIYYRLGYGMEAYTYLLDEGMSVSNAICEHRELLKKHGSPFGGIDALEEAKAKKALKKIEKRIVEIAAEHKSTSKSKQITKKK